MSILIVDKLLGDATLNLVNKKLDDNPDLWEDGKNTAHGSAKNRKSNRQMVTQTPVLDDIYRIVLAAIRRNTIVQNSLLPVHVLYSMVNEHSKGAFYGKHVDRPMRFLTKNNKYVRCDLSMTVFLSDPETYQGGELVIYDGSSQTKVKLKAGCAVIYPTSFLHEVKEVTEGTRKCIVTWMQSGIADAHERQIVADALKLSHAVSKESVNTDTHALASKLYNNLIRKFAEF